MSEHRFERPTVTPAPCGYPQHRGHDWRQADGSGVATCGVCHPPADGLDVKWLGEPGPFSKAVAARIGAARDSLEAGRAKR